MTDVFYGPRSRSNARALLAAAAELGLDARVVRTTQNGYFVPGEIVSFLEGVAEIEEGVTYPPPPEDAPEDQQVLERPRGNFGREKWAEYAKFRGLEVADEDTRDDIIVKVDTFETNEKETD